MSKFLKFIVHFIIICTILVAVALAVPPFFGVTTEISTKAGTGSNLPLGSVTYAIPVKASEIRVGDPVLVTDNNVTSRYNINSLDLAVGTGTVVDPTVVSPEPVNVAIKEYAPKVVITIGLIGYLMIATQSVEGLIILGLSILFLIILYVIAELWKKPQNSSKEPAAANEPPADDLADAAAAAGKVKSQKELKKEEMIRARYRRAEEMGLLKKGRAAKAAVKEEEAEKSVPRPDKKRRTIRTGGFVDVIDEEDALEGEEEETVDPAGEAQFAASEAHELLKKEMAAAAAEDAALESEEELEARKNQSKENAGSKGGSSRAGKGRESASEDGEAPRGEPLGKLAIPRLTPAQLAARAKKAGDAPEVVRDSITKVVLLDYSDLFPGNDEGGKS